MSQLVSAHLHVVYHVFSGWTNIEMTSQWVDYATEPIRTSHEWVKRLECVPDEDATAVARGTFEVGLKKWNRTIHMVTPF